MPPTQNNKRQQTSMWVMIGTDFFNTNHIAVIRPVDDGDDQTVIFTAGQSAVDGGFLVDVATEDVFEVVKQARFVELAQLMSDEEDENDRNSDSGHLGPVLVETESDE